MKKVVHKVVSNSIFLMISSVGATFFSFFYWLVIGKLLLPSDYGIISTAINFSVFLSTIATFGLSYTLLKLIPEYTAKKQYVETSTLMGFSLKFMILSSLILGAFIIIFSNPLSTILNIPKNAVNIASIVLISITMSVYFNSVLQGFQNMKVFSITQISGQFSKLLLSVILVVLGFGYIGPIFGFISLYVIASLISLKFIKLTLDSSNIDYKKILFHYSLPAFLSTVLSYIFFSGRFLILNTLKTSSSTGIFSLATTMTAPIILVPNVLLQAIFPLASEMAASKKHIKSLTSTISRFMKYSFMITLPSVVFISIFSKPLILVFSRYEYLESGTLFPILGVSSLIFTMGSIFYQTLYSLGKTQIYRNIMIFSIIVFLATSIPLTYTFSEYGMSIAVLVFSSVYSVLSYFYLKKFMKLAIPYSSLGKIILSTILSMGVLYYITTFGSNLILDVISTIVGAILYFSLLLAFKFVDKTDINLFHNLISRIPFLKKYLYPIIIVLYRWID